MRYNKRKQKIHLYLLIILGLTVGFALISTTLKINGIANLKGNTWSIHWDEPSINVTSGSVSATTPDVTTSTNTDDTVSFDVNLTIPKDYYEFTIDAVNDGSVDAALDLSQNWITYTVDGVESTLPNYLEFSVTYANGSIPQTGDILKANRSKTYKIRITYKDDEEYLPDDDDEIILGVMLPYVPYKEEIPKPRTCAQFESDSWSTIINNVKINESVYPVGCEKDITLNNYGTHTLRVANNTTPDECLGDNYSQTACGFVLEFADVIDKHYFNENGIYNSYLGEGTNGGWEYSDIRAYVNGTKYLEGDPNKEVDYTGSGIYDSFPNEIKSAIITTKVVSGGYIFQPLNVDIYTTIDKLYLPSLKELNNNSDNNSDRTYTRSLDIYLENTGGTKSTKTYNSEQSNWMLRSASNSTTGYIFYVTYTGSVSNSNAAYYQYGISPAFRIGKDWVLTNSLTPLKSQKWEYYLNSRKKLQNGWYKLKDFYGVDQYYFFENGFMKLGWYTDTNNNTYYLSEFDEDNNSYVDGKRLTNTTRKIDGVSYTFDSNGICTSGCQ